MSRAQQRISGNYLVKNYSQSQYKAHSQNWQILQDSLGIMYFANNNGVLTYDGLQFRLYQTPNKSVVRSIAYAHQRVYYGAQNDFGYLSPDSTGDLAFHSLSALVDSSKLKFKDVWKVYADSDSNVYFFSLKTIFKWDQHQIETLSTERFFYFPFLIRHKLLIQEAKTRIGFWDGKEVEPLGASSIFFDKPVFYADDAGENTILFATEADGLFLWENGVVRALKTEVDSALKSGLIYSGYRLKNGNLALSTRKKGSFVLDKEGRLIHHFSVESGLNSDIHWNIFEDRAGDIWIATDNGFTHVSLKEGLTFLDSSLGLKGATEVVQFYKDGLITAGRSGFSEFKNRRFQNMEGFNAETWALLQLPNEVLIAASDGIFSWNGNKSIQLDSKSDRIVWLSLYYDSVNDRVLAGAVNGLYVLKKRAGKWEIKKIEEIPDETRTILEDEQHQFWLATRYTGIIHLKLDSDNKVLKMKRYQENTPLKSSISRVFKDEKGILLSDFTLFYRPDSQNDTIRVDTESSKYYIQNNDGTFLQRLKQYQDATITIHDRNDQNYIKVFRKEKSSLLLRTDMIPQFERAISFDYQAQNSTAVFSSNEDLLIWNLNEAHLLPEMPAPNIRKVQINQDQIIFNGYVNGEMDKEKITFGAPLLSIRFEFASPTYNLDETHQFQYRLVGQDSVWSPMADEAFTKYSNVSAGNYRFEVRSEHPSGIISKPTYYVFSVVNPWYADTPFYVFISLVLLFLIAYISRFISIQPLIRRISRLEIEQKMHLERERISKELHDNIGSHLVQLASGLDLADLYKTKGKIEEADNLVRGLRDETQSVITHLRQAVWSMKQDEVKLNAFFQRLGELIVGLLKHQPTLRFEKKIALDDSDPLLNTELEPEKALHLFRIVQEACNNSIKYAESSLIKLEIYRETHQDKQLCICISDDGKGFDIQERPGGFGLSNMKNRAEQAGCSIKIESTIGMGTKISLFCTL